MIITVLFIHPVVQTESNSRNTLSVNELYSSEPYRNNAAHSPIRYGFYVGFVGGRPSADWVFGEISLASGRDYRSVFMRTSNWFTISNHEPREVELTVDLQCENLINTEVPIAHQSQHFLIR